MLKYIGIVLVAIVALIMIIGILYAHIGLWFISLLLIPLLWFAGAAIRERRKPPEERQEYQIKEKQKALQAGLQQDVRWFDYINGTTCICCGKTKPRGAQLCYTCCPICGNRKTKQALICKNCLRNVPREDILNLSSEGGGPTKREIRIAIACANVPIRIQKILDAAAAGQELKYGPELGVDLNAEQVSQEQVKGDESAGEVVEDTEGKEREYQVWGRDHHPEYW